MPEPIKWFDTHTHLNGETYRETLEAVLDRSRAAGVVGWLAIGTDLADSFRGVKLAWQYEDFYCTVGIHPHEADKQSTDYMAKLQSLAQSQVACAIGEIGLDYHYDFSKPADQQRIFRDQLTLAAEVDKPVVIHCREAVADCLAILDEWDHPLDRVVFHCFTGTRAEAEAILDRGMWLSFTGTITFKKSLENQQIAQYVPLERVMLETDCPYLSPEPVRNTRPNEPALLAHTAAKFAELRGKRLEEIADQIYRNSCSFFNLDSIQANLSLDPEALNELDRLMEG